MHARTSCFQRFVPAFATDKTTTCVYNYDSAETHTLVERHIIPRIRRCTPQTASRHNYCPVDPHGHDSFNRLAHQIYELAPRGTLVWRNAELRSVILL